MVTNSLEQLIIDRIQREGHLTFAEYMRMALYEPGYGYYVTGPAKMGWQGDYFTSTDVSFLFAHCVTRQLRRFWEILKRPAPFVVLEQGAGRGDLSEGIRARAALEDADFGAALTCYGTDIHSGQDALYSRAGSSGQSKSEALQPHVIFSNELVDAFPVHIVQTYQSKLYEVYVDVQAGKLREILDEPSSTEVATYLDNYGIPWQTFGDHWRAEINLDALRWMEQTARLLTGTGSRRRHGFLLTIDYGEKARDLYTKYRRYGTLACYYRHQLTERPLARPGEQDLTAHVNFTALIDAGRKQGLRLHTFTTQRAWLSEMGIDEELAQIRKRDYALIDSERASDRGQVALLQWYNLRQRAAVLTDPSGMGNFKVLIMKS